jgi:hypothetical protein
MVHAVYHTYLIALRHSVHRPSWPEQVGQQAVAGCMKKEAMFLS